MGWANELYNVYDVALKLPIEQRKTLIPIYHTTVNVQIEVSINKNGDFNGACVVFNNKKKSKQMEDESVSSDIGESSVTIIPGGARANGISPQPLADKLVYLAGDYCDYCNFKKGDEKKYTAYIKQLEEWADSEFSHPSVKAVYNYLSKGSLIHDILKTGLFKVDSTNKLTDDKIENTEQKNCFVRFVVNGSCEERRTWLDQTLYDSFIRYTNSKQTNIGFCYATGEQTSITYNHPKKILNAGDQGKLFSANDETGFTFKGRFFEKEQAYAIGYEFSQKMHNALKWLIETRGIYVNGMQVVAWNSTLDSILNICADSDEFIDDCDYLDDLDSEADGASSAEYEIMFANYKNALHKSIFKDNFDLNYNQKIMVMILDEASTGRVSVNMYRELSQSDFYRYVEKWHKDTAWERYSFKEKQNKIGSFSLSKLAEFAFGTEQNSTVNGEEKCVIKCSDKLKKETIARLIPCVIEGRNLPKDILRNLVNRASRPLSYSLKGNWRNVLNAACGMIRKAKIEKGEICNMDLDENRNDRDYLYGRLLAVADVAEELINYIEKEERLTNAERYFEKFSNSPALTWAMMRKRLSPYFNKMNPYLRKKYKKLIDEITIKFKDGEFSDNSKLKPDFLLAYSCQRKELYTKTNNTDKSQEEEL